MKSLQTKMTLIVLGGNHRRSATTDKKSQKVHIEAWVNDFNQPQIQFNTMGPKVS